MWPLLLSIFLLASACSNAPPRRTRVLLDWWPNPVHLPLYVGLEKGFFKQHGLEIEILKCSEPPQTLMMLMAGRAEIVLSSTPNVLRALDRGTELHATAVLIDRPLRSFVFLQSSGINTPQDFHMRTLGGNPEGVLTAYVKQFMETQQIRFSQIRKLSWDTPSALMSQSVDIVAGAYWNIEPEQLRAVGIDTAYFRIEEFGVPSYDEMVFVSKQGWATTYPQRVQAFRKGLQQSIDWCKHNPAAAFAIYCSCMTTKTERVLTWERRAWETTAPLFANTQQFSHARWQSFHDWMLKHHLLKQPLNLRQLLQQDG